MTRLETSSLPKRRGKPSAETLSAIHFYRRLYGPNPIVNVFRRQVVMSALDRSLQYLDGKELAHYYAAIAQIRKRP
jgi:hypothetical protein